MFVVIAILLAWSQCLWFRVQGLGLALRKMSARRFLTIQCPNGGPEADKRVCRNGITAKLQVGSIKNDVKENLRWRMAQHMAAVHEVDYEDAMRDLKYWEVEEWEEANDDGDQQNDDRSRSRSPRDPPDGGSRQRIETRSSSSTASAHAVGLMNLNADQIREVVACLNCELLRRLNCELLQRR
jgi:hypothetical protein